MEPGSQGPVMLPREQQPRLLDLHFARFMAARCGLAGGQQRVFHTVIQSLSQAMENGHSCLKVIEDEAALLGRSPLVSATPATPLVLVGERLYLQRYYLYEKRLATRLKMLASTTDTEPGLTAHSWPKLLNRVFGPEGDEADYQRRAAEVALKKSLCIISGGPGTGKTTTVVKIIGLLLEVLGSDLRIALAAPTGKAAMRLQESVGNSLQGIDFPAEIVERIPTSASTLHRLLGVRKNSSQFLHNADRPLAWDVVVVDEASMIDLAMMSKLVDALPAGARLILLGDKDQLASVESGAVLNDCIKSLPENTGELKKSYRFNAGIKALAHSINCGDGEKAWQLLAGDEFANISLLRNSYFRFIGDRYLLYMQEVQRAVQQMTHGGIAAVFAAFSRFQVLCAGRHGARGVQGINAGVEKIIKTSGYEAGQTPWYLGRPVMITTNDYNLGLFNGDIGICLPDVTPDGDGTMKVWFEKPDGSLQKFPPYRIPRCETVFGMTIHKSQGSEFSEVLIVLPEEEGALLNRQLVYTGVTRAKEFAHIVASKQILVYALQSDYPRNSGLADMLLHGDGEKEQ